MDGVADRWGAAFRSRVLPCLAGAIVGAVVAGGPARAGEVAPPLARGINVLGYDPLWSDPATARFQARHFAVIRDGGFDHVRVNLQAFAHMDAENQLDPAWLATLDRVVAQARAAHLAVILDEHDHQPCGEDAAGCGTRLLAFWQQIAARYRDQPPSVLFELLNEPNGQLTADAWNALLSRLLAVVRADNPARTVVIGPANYNDRHRLAQLVLPPDDRHILVTVHDYDPLAFTHQGAPWMPAQANTTGVTWGSDADRQAVGRDLDEVALWAKEQDRPVLVGEFGAYDKADMASRAAWTATVARAAEARGFGWTYWQFDRDFVAYDLAKDAWVGPIHDALVPP